MPLADLANVVNIAAIKASNDNKAHVTLEDLEFAKDRIMMASTSYTKILSRGVLCILEKTNSRLSMLSSESIAQSSLFMWPGV